METDSAGVPQRLYCSVIGEDEKPKGAIHWVDKASAVQVEVRLYEPLFTVEEPSDDHWEEELNRASERIVSGALVDPHLLSYSPAPEMHFQFERVGFFVVDKDSKPDGIVFNSTVSLKDSKPKAPGASSKSRKDEQAKQLAEKLARMSIPPEQFFLSQTDLYSAFDEEGVPTHDAKGEKLSKSAFKNLKKDWEKQKKLYEKFRSEDQSTK